MENKEKLLTEVKELYVKYCETYQSWQRDLKANEKLTQLKKISRELEDKAEKLVALATRDTDEHKKFTILLGYARNAKAEWMYENPQLIDETVALCQNTIKLLEPYAFDVMGAYPRLFACSRIALLCTKGVKGLEATMKCIEFTSKFPKKHEHANFRHGTELFEIPINIQSTEFQDYQREHNVSGVVKNLFDNFNKCFEWYKVKTAKAFMNFPTFEGITKGLKSGDLMIRIEALWKLREMIEPFLNFEHFKQALHFLAIGMHHTVKIRQNLKGDEKRKIDGIQSGFSQRFAEYGLLIAQKSYAKLEGSSYYVKHGSSNYIELTELIEDGMEIYTSQFPINAVDSYAEARKILKRAFAWNNRALELCPDREPYKENLASFKNSMISMMNMIDDAIKREKNESSK